MSDLVNWLNNWDSRPRYNKALSLLNDAHQACFKSPDRDVLGMSHGPFSGVNEVLGMFAGIEEDFKCAATALTLANERIARLEEALTEAVAVYGREGGPWNVPSDPDGWLDRARAALKGDA